MVDMENLSAQDARECAAFLETAEAAILAALSRVALPDESPRFVRFLVITALVRLATQAIESALLEHAADRVPCTALIAEMTRRLSRFDAPERTH